MSESLLVLVVSRPAPPRWFLGQSPHKSQPGMFPHNLTESFAEQGGAGEGFQERCTRRCFLSPPQNGRKDFLCKNASVHKGGRAREKVTAAKLGNVESSGRSDKSLADLKNTCQPGITNGESQAVMETNSSYCRAPKASGTDSSRHNWRAGWRGWFMVIK